MSGAEGCTSAACDCPSHGAAGAGGARSMGCELGYGGADAFVAGYAGRAGSECSLKEG
jgi:hypothetical protein